MTDSKLEFAAGLNIRKTRIMLDALIDIADLTGFDKVDKAIKIAARALDRAGYELETDEES